jgi:hypothetical protein
MVSASKALYSLYLNNRQAEAIIEEVMPAELYTKFVESPTQIHDILSDPVVMDELTRSGVCVCVCCVGSCLPNTCMCVDVYTYVCVHIHTVARRRRESRRLSRAASSQHTPMMMSPRDPVFKLHVQSPGGNTSKDVKLKNKDHAFTFARYKSVCGCLSVLVCECV